jgi:glyoxylase-like metal-dependent hydrolase (beta-lactamase superfamily II)
MTGALKLQPVVMLLLATVTWAAGGGSTFETTQLADTLYLLTTDQGAYTTNTIASVGPDGVLLVDTQAASDAEELKRVVEDFGKGTPKFIINTHRHVEHVGGNAIFGEEPIVIAHELVRNKLRSGSYLFEEFPDATLPDITITDSMSLYFNGEEIRLIAMPGGHDDNEIIVHFTESKVVHLSSLVNGFNFPSVDSDGNALGFAPLLAKAIEMLPEDVLIVSGHNSPGRFEQLLAYHDMLVATADVVRVGLAVGMDTTALKEEGAIDEWQQYAGSYVSTDGWIDYLAAAIQGMESGQTVYEPIYHALRGQGAEAAIALYHELKKNHADEYGFRDTDLMVIGNKLLKTDRIQPAIRFLELSLREYPESPFAYYANYNLAKAHKRLGERERAIEFCEKALEQSPDDPTVASLLEELRSEESG